MCKNSNQGLETCRANGRSGVSRSLCSPLRCGEEILLGLETREEEEEGRGKMDSGWMRGCAGRRWRGLEALALFPVFWVYYIHFTDDIAGSWHVVGT